jgi:hypothetical protein
MRAEFRSTSMETMMSIAADRRLHEPGRARGSSPDSLLPPVGDVTATLQPERRLMLAILEGAVTDFQKYATATNGLGRRLFAEADAWFASTAADRLVDFENICLALGLEPSFIRAGLRGWCIARRREGSRSRTVLRFPFRRMCGTRHHVAM